MTGLLDGKVVVLSGVGPGLGRSLGEQAALMGADLVLASRTEKRLQKMAGVIEEHGRRALVVPTDITDEDARRHLVDAALEEFGHVDVLLNNAFGIPPMDPLTQIPLDALRLAQESNVYAPLRLSALFADALAHLASSLATELGPRGIRVNSVAPSYIYEDVNKAYFDWMASESGRTHEDVYREKAAPTDLKRLATPEEVARAALFLGSDLASAVTGTVLNVDCGEFHD